MPRYPEHLRGFAYLGPHRYFLTFCTSARARHFTSDPHVALVCDQFLRALHEEHFAGMAYCFMPDHVHLVVAGERDDADLKRFIKSAKQYSGFHFRQRTGCMLWQRYGFERVLRDEESTVDVVRYTVANPVRARIVQALEEYPFWGSFVYTRADLLEYISQASRYRAT